MVIPDFTDAERRCIQRTCDERWQREPVELHAADVELQLDTGATLTECPAIFWQVDDCNFVIAKTGERQFRCHFFYRDDLEQYGPGAADYDDVAECALTLLRMQADHQSMRSGQYPGRGEPR